MSHVAKDWCVGDSLACELGQIFLCRFLGRGKSAYSWLARLSDQPLVFKAFHKEPCDTYLLPDDKLGSEIACADRLKALGISCPGVLLADPERDFLLKEYIAGPTGDQLVADGPLDSAMVEQLFRMQQKIAAGKGNLDWFPPNFVLQNKVLYYVDFEINNYDSQWSLQEWGLYYWVNQRGMQLFRETGEMTGLESPDKPGKPRREGFESRVAAWIAANPTDNPHR